MTTHERQFNFNNFPVKTSGLAVFFLVVLFFLTAPNIFGRTLAKYRGGIRSAKLATQNLLAPDLEDESFDDYADFERATLTQIRADVPVSEKIEWQNTTVETNNQWLTDKLAQFEKGPQNSSKRELILTDISERLDAIEQKLEELENPALSNRSKDEDKQKLAEILRREEFQKPPEDKEESFFAKIYRRIMEWIAQMFPRPNIPESKSNESNQSISFVLQIILYALILGIIGFLVYRFAPFLANRFRTREKREKKERVILGERLAANETSQNLFNEAENLARQGNLRGAIRKGYIALLCELSERKIITLSQNKTNRDYLRDVRKKDELYENMSGLTNKYERHWYGFSEAESGDWEEFRKNYQKTINIR